MDREALIKRRDELQSQYNQVNNHARELAGAIAAFDEMIESLEAVSSTSEPDSEPEDKSELTVYPISG